MNVWVRKNTPRSSFAAFKRTKQSNELNPTGLDRPALILGDKERAQQQNVPSTQTPLAVSVAAGEFCIKSLHLFIYLFMCVPVLFILGGFGMHQLSKMMHGFLRFYFFHFNLSANRSLCTADLLRLFFTQRTCQAWKNPARANSKLGFCANVKMKKVQYDHVKYQHLINVSKMLP